jgi:hypothetical protein
LLSIFCIAGLLNIIYTLTFYDHDLLSKSPEIIRLRSSADSTDVYYFGESSNVTFAETDSTKKSISQLISLYYPGLRLTNINKYATHGGIYKSWVREVVTRQPLPTAMIITLNLRSFDAAWRHSDLETSLQESLVMSGPYPNIVNRFLLSLQAFDNKTPQQREKDMLEEWQNTKLRFPFPFRYSTVAEWDYAMAQGSYKKPDGSWDTEKIALACHFIKSYAFNLDENNPRIKDFDEIVTLCRDNGITLYLNLMAENMEFANDLVGKELVFLMRQNRDYLVKRYNTNSCRVIDNLELVAAASFLDKTWTTEHYDYKGRMKIASNVARVLQPQFEEQFFKAY